MSTNDRLHGVRKSLPQGLSSSDVERVFVILDALDHSASEVFEVFDRNGLRLVTPSTFQRLFDSNIQVPRSEPEVVTNDPTSLEHDKESSHSFPKAARLIGRECSSQAVVSSRKSSRIPPAYGPSAMINRLSIRRLRIINTYSILALAVLLFASGLPKAAAVDPHLQAIAPSTGSSNGGSSHGACFAALLAISGAVLQRFGDVLQSGRVSSVLGGLMAALGFGSIFVASDERMPAAMQIAVAVIWSMSALGFVGCQLSRGDMGIWQLLFASIFALVVYAMGKDPDAVPTAYFPGAVTMGLIAVLKTTKLLTDVWDSVRMWLHNASRPRDDIV